LRYHPQASPFAVKIRRDAMRRRTDVIVVSLALLFFFLAKMPMYEGADMQTRAQLRQQL